mmetsp:Transcript_7033/g.22185  ORF Transcript_7033/g.22185 Transcript_7033/m.22185 type:complete len:346 (-) Transcript_7033:24-1061(-)
MLQALVVASLAVAARALVPPPARWETGVGPRVKPARLSCFLTQRAVQQTLYYMWIGMDHTKRDFLAEYLRPPPDDDDEGRRTRAPPLDEDYHGVAALPTATSRDYLCQLLQEPDLEITIKKEMGCGGGRGHGGLNSFTGEPINRQNNPYLKPRYYEYTEEIDPAEIARRIFSGREQIAAELRDDLLDLVEKEGAAARGRALFDEDQPTFDDTRMGAADGTRASPFRAANYELVLQLATAHAVECLLRRDRVDTTLAERWRENKERFYGHNQWTRGDSGRRSLTDRFISSLVLATKPSADGEGLVCPADEVLAARVDVARDFADALTLAPDEHLRWSAWKLEASLA